MLYSALFGRAPSPPFPLEHLELVVQGTLGSLLQGDTYLVVNVGEWESACPGIPIASHIPTVDASMVVHKCING